MTGESTTFLRTVAIYFLAADRAVHRSIALWNGRILAA